MTRTAWFSIAVVSSVLVFGPASFVVAQDTIPMQTLGATTAVPLFNPNGKAPDISAIPVLTNIVKGGGKLYYLGERSGLHGWFIVKNQQIQMIYLSPDQQSVLIGGMFTAKGENVTTPQITMLTEQNADIKAVLSGSAREQQEIMKAGEEGGAGAVSSGAKVDAPSKKDGALPAVPVSPGERLMYDLKAAAGVNVGNNPDAELMMLVAPSCPNCKSTWKELRSAVRANKIQVRLIPVYNSVGGVESQQAAQLLKVENPLEAWDRFVEGDASALAGTPDEMAIRAVVSNLNLVSKWNIQGYPYLVYRGKDGRIKIVQGKPERMAALLTDIKQ